MLKKIAYFACFALCITVFSCASAPETEGKNLSDAVQEMTPETKTEEAPENSEKTEKDDLSDLEQVLTEEENPELPELPAEKESVIDVTSEEPEILPEPAVKDTPVEESGEPMGEKAGTDGLLDEKKTDSVRITDGNDSEKTDGTEDSRSISEKEESGSISDTEKTDSTEISGEEITETEEKTEPGKVQVMPTPSRSLTIQKNQLIDIIYPGKGWIYQGNIDSEGNIDTRNRNFVFGGRKLGGADTSFTLRSRTAGTFLLHFYKNDTLTGSYIDDYLEVTVQDKAANSTDHILAPNYAEIVPPKASITAEKIKEEKKQQKLAEEAKKAAEAQEKTVSEKKNPAAGKTASASGNSKTASDSADSSIDTIIQTTESSPTAASPVVKTESASKKQTAAKTENTSGSETASDDSSDLENQNADQLLTTAKKYYDSKEYPKAYIAISKFFDKAASRLDEGLYLRGQILEEKSPVQNIKNAIESYDLVVKNYPASALWDKASKRSIFLKRFYINIR